MGLYLIAPGVKGMVLYECCPMYAAVHSMYVTSNWTAVDARTAAAIFVKLDSYLCSQVEEAVFLPQDSVSIVCMRIFDKPLECLQHFRSIDNEIFFLGFDMVSLENTVCSWTPWHS